MPSKQRQPQIVGSDHSVFPEGVLVTADELPPTRTSTVTGRAAAQALQAIIPADTRRTRS